MIKNVFHNYDNRHIHTQHFFDYLLTDLGKPPYTTIVSSNNALGDSFTKHANLQHFNNFFLLIHQIDLF